MPSNYYIKRLRQRLPHQHRSQNSWSRSISQLDQDVFEKSVAMKTSLQNLRKAKELLRNCIKKVINYEDEMREKTQAFNEDTEELREAAQDIRNLYKYEGKEQILLNLHTTFAMEDVSAAQKRIKQITDELENMSPIVKDSTSADPNASLRCYDQVSIPEPSTIKISHCSVKSKPVHTCSICMENEVDCVIVECGHVCMCLQCVPQLLSQTENAACPICRCKFKEIIILAPY